MTTRLFTRAALLRASLALTALVAGLAFVGDASAADRRVRIINDTSVDMREFYASNVDTSSWEEDILGKSLLPAGSSVMINIDDGTGACLFDFRAIFVDGDVLEDDSINVCQIESYRYHE